MAEEAVPEVVEELVPEALWERVSPTLRAGGAPSRCCLSVRRAGIATLAACHAMIGPRWPGSYMC